MKTIKKAWRWLVVSSADPKKTSLTIKGFGLMLVTAYSAYLLPTLKVACEFGYLCGALDPEFLMILNNIVEFASQITYYGLMLVSVFAMFWGSMRKAWKTLNGDHAAFQE